MQRRSRRKNKQFWFIDKIHDPYPTDQRGILKYDGLMTDPVFLS